MLPHRLRYTLLAVALLAVAVPLAAQDNCVQECKSKLTDVRDKPGTQPVLEVFENGQWKVTAEYLAAGTPDPDQIHAQHLASWRQPSPLPPACPSGCTCIIVKEEWERGWRDWKNDVVEVQSPGGRRYRKTWPVQRKVGKGEGVCDVKPPE